MALLVNTSTWYEFKHNWKLICLVFLQLYIGKDNIGKEYQDALLKKIIKIKSDINIVDAIKQTVLDQDENTKTTSEENLYDFYDDEEDGNFSRITKQKVREILRTK